MKSVEDEAWYFNLAHTRCVGEEGQSVERSHCGCCVYTSIIFYLNINMYIYTYIYRYIYPCLFTYLQLRVLVKGLKERLMAFE